MRKHPKVAVYAEGPLMCSVCAPADMDGPSVAALVERQHPAGTEDGWTVADEPFRSGQPNPCSCNLIESRLHWLLAC